MTSKVMDSTSLRGSLNVPTFLIIYTVVKPEARKSVFPPFHFLSLQPYRNSWVTSDRNTHKITMKTDVSKKEKNVYAMPAVRDDSK